MTKQRAVVVSRFTLAAIASLAVSAPPRAGRAFEASSHPCFKTAPNWNARNGALVSGISSGPVSAIFTALGQSRTHVMIANVTPDGYWATESTTLQPSIHTKTISVCTPALPLIPSLCKVVGEIPDPGMPLAPRELAKGTPGFSAINMGGAYAYWSGATQVFRQLIFQSSKPVETRCMEACQASGVADWLWFKVPYEVKTSGADSSTWYYSLTPTDEAGNNMHMSYGVHQFMDGYDRARQGLGGESPGRRGIVCSEVPAWGYRNWARQTDEDLSGYSKALRTHQYSHDETVNAGQALWDSVYHGCMNQDVGFWGGLANQITSLTGSSVQNTTCSAAAYQVLNCFFQGESADGSGCTSSATTPWSDYVAAATADGANSLSPDDVMGLSRSGYEGPWSTASQHTLQWNGGGQTYGCFY